MTLKAIDPKVQEALAEVAQVVGGDGAIHIQPIRVCDGCGVADMAQLPNGKEAWVFPYYVDDQEGNFYEHLCNECFDRLGCSYPDEDEGGWV